MGIKVCPNRPLRVACSERTADEANQMRELDSILNEAQKLESDLRERKKRLRQMLALISDKLQG